VTDVRRHALAARRTGAALVAGLLLLSAGVARAAGAGGGELTPAQQKTLRENYALSVSKLKGPYTENFCVCPGGAKRPVRSASGALGTGCKDPIFCSAYRAPWAEALAHERVYIANLFARDLYHWDSFPDHHDLVRGIVLEKYFVETNPEHKFAQLRAFGGLAGSEFETEASDRFFERYLASPDFQDGRHFLLAYELQKRFAVRGDMGQVQRVRAMAVRVQGMDARFKPLRDAIHNQISAALVPRVAAYRDKLPAGAERQQVDEIVTELRKLTTLDESVLGPLVAELEDAGVRARFESLRAKPGSDGLAEIEALAALMRAARETVAARGAGPADQRRLVDLDVAASNVLLQRGGALLEAPESRSVGAQLRLARALTDAAYGAGLLSPRERGAAANALDALLAMPSQPRADFARGFTRAERIVEWAQANTQLAFAEVWAPWTFVLPAVAGIGDDILRGSPLLLYARLAARIDEHASGRVRHDLFGAEIASGVRALNPGLAVGPLRVAPQPGGYVRSDVVALESTPSDLSPAAGILTQGEGNVLSHVQLLARALGVPNAVVGSEAYATLRPQDGRSVFYAVTPAGRVVVKDAAQLGPAERTAFAEYTRNEKRTGDGRLAAAEKLHIDKARLDLTRTLPLGLDEVRRADSGRSCGPKAAFLGELKHLVPEHVARGIVVPFGAYHAHYQRAKVAVPARLGTVPGATPGEPLPAFVERTYAEFFGTLVASGRPDAELSAWIAPRLEVMRHSIRETPLAPELVDGIRAGLAKLGLLLPNDPTRTVGCFVRSDTNVEDLDNFNGAGLNLTLFNRKSLADIHEALKEVWASPFSLRSFSWRQTLIDEPLWVLPSVVILESVPSEKSGVLITADAEHGDMTKMLVATSEGVGGAVDGTSAETLLWSPTGVELITQFKSPWKTALQADGGSAVVPSTGRDTVLEPAELEALVTAGKKIAAGFEPARDPAGKPRPWDIEFGFTNGRLWLFQSRPFIGNDALKNVPALAALDATDAQGPATISLEDPLP
jgi:hypothetical protein